MSIGKASAGLFDSNRRFGEPSHSRRSEQLIMTDPIAAAVRTSSAKSDRSMNAILNYSIAAVVFLAAAGIFIGIWIW
jgi:hypothetical protein